MLKRGFLINVYLCLMLSILFVSASYSQNFFRTSGVILVDTISFDGYYHIVGKGKNNFILSFDSTYYDNIEDFVSNGGALYVYPLFFQVMLNKQYKKNVDYSQERDRLSEDDKVSDYTYRFKKKIIVGVIAVDDLNEISSHGVRINLPRKLIWICSKVK